jgi:hypothetical protein
VHEGTRAQRPAVREQSRASMKRFEFYSNLTPGGFAPRTPLQARSRGPPLPHSARLARSLSLARVAGFVYRTDLGLSDSVYYLGCWLLASIVPGSGIRDPRIRSAFAATPLRRDSHRLAAARGLDSRIRGLAIQG